MSESIELKLPRVGAKILEGVANGFSIAEMGWALRDEPPLSLDSMKQYARVTYSALHLAARSEDEGSYYRHPRDRAVGMILAAGILQPKDLQRPGQVFEYTMAPPPDCPIQYVDTYHKGSGPDLAAHVWPTTPILPMRVPNRLVRLKESTTLVDSELRNYLAATLLGMDAREINEQGISSLTKAQLKHQRAPTGLKTTVQFAAHCATQGIIDVPETILDPQAIVEPIIYDEPAWLNLPLGVVNPDRQQ